MQAGEKTKWENHKMDFNAKKWETKWTAECNLSFFAWCQNIIIFFCFISFLGAKELHGIIKWEKIWKWYVRENVEKKNNNNKVMYNALRDNLEYETSGTFQNIKI